MSPITSSHNWILGLAILVALLALLVGVLSTHTDLLNFNTSAAEVNAMNAKTQVETEKGQADVAVYRAQKEAEIASAQAAVQAQRQAAAFQAFKSMIDQEFYLVGKAAEALKQQADIEVHKARQLAEIRAWEEDQAQKRALEQARAVRDVENARLTSYGVLAGGGVIVLAIALAIFIVAIRFAKSPTVAKQAIPTQAKEAIESVEAPRAADEKALERAYWLGRRRQARANEFAFNTLQIAEQVARGPTSSEAAHQGNGKHPARSRHPSAYAR